ncbi:MAG: RNA polymerase sigma factor [Candidatus Brocadiia bacterium]
MKETNRMQNLSDEQLWSEYVDGSGEALDELRNRHEEALFRYLLLSLDDMETAARALGQVFCVAAEYQQQPDGFKSIRCWLYAIATQNVCPAFVPQQHGIMDFVDELRQKEPSNRDEKIRRALIDMQRSLRQPFLLMTIGGLNLSETARACRFPEKKTRDLISKAYQRLAKSGLFEEE